jgi:DNA polymerase-3 subunit delta'
MTPWLADAAARVDAAIASGRLAHAILVHEDPGAGGAALADWIAERRLGPGAASRGHPDLTRIAPTEESRQIRIDDVRSLGAELALTSHAGGEKVAIVAPADALNALAANALLKTLEDPPPRSLIVLVASMPSRLPVTVRSRCLVLRVRAPAPQVTRAWLEASRPGPWERAIHVVGNAPLVLAALDPHAIDALWTETDRALRDVEAGAGDPPALGERFGRGEPLLRLACVETWLTDRVRDRVGGEGATRELRGRPHLPGAGRNLNIASLFELLDAVRDLRSRIDTPINKALAFERLLWLLAAAAGAGAGRHDPIRGSGRR